MGIGGQNYPPAALPREKDQVSILWETWAPKVGLDGCGKSRPLQDSIQAVASSYTDHGILGNRIKVLEKNIKMSLSICFWFLWFLFSLDFKFVTLCTHPPPQGKLKIRQYMRCTLPRFTLHKLRFLRILATYVQSNVIFRSSNISSASLHKPLLTQSVSNIKTILS
jgi:hypothetical protein